MRKNKSRNAKRGLPARKRLKLSDGIGVASNNAHESIETTSQKRMVQDGTEPPMAPPRKRVKRQTDIRAFTQRETTKICGTKNIQSLLILC